MKWIDLSSHGMALRVLTLPDNRRVLVLENGDVDKSAARELGFRYLKQSGLWVRENLRFSRAEFGRVLPGAQVIEVTEEQIARRARPTWQPEATPETKPTGARPDPADAPSAVAPPAASSEGAEWVPSEDGGAATTEARDSGDGATDLLVASREVYEGALWAAMNARWDAGQDVVAGTSLKQWVAKAKHRDAFRFTGGRLEMFEGRRRGRDVWIQVGPTGQLIDSLAQYLGLPTSWDRFKAGTSEAPTEEDIAEDALTADQVEFRVAAALGVGEGAGFTGLTEKNLAAAFEWLKPENGWTEDDIRQVIEIVRTARPDLAVDALALAGAPQAPQVPEAVASRVQGALAVLKEVAVEVERVRDFEERQGVDRGRLQADVLRNRAGDIAAAQGIISEFRDRAKEQGVDADSHLAEWGPLSDLTPSAEAAEWLQATGGGAVPVLDARLEQKRREARDAGRRARNEGGARVAPDFLGEDLKEDWLEGFDERVREAAAERRRAAAALEAEQREAIAASPAAPWVRETFGEDFASPATTLALVRFLDGADEAFSGHVNRQWLPGLEKLGHSAGSLAGVPQSKILASIRDAFHAAHVPVSPAEVHQDILRVIAADDQVVAMVMNNPESNRPLVNEALRREYAERLAARLAEELESGNDGFVDTYRELAERRGVDALDLVAEVRGLMRPGQSSEEKSKTNEANDAIVADKEAKGGEDGVQAPVYGGDEAAGAGDVPAAGGGRRDGGARPGEVGGGAQDAPGSSDAARDGSGAAESHDPSGSGGAGPGDADRVPAGRPVDGDLTSADEGRAWTVGQVVQQIGQIGQTGPDHSRYRVKAVRENGMVVLGDPMEFIDPRQAQSGMEIEADPESLTRASGIEGAVRSAEAEAFERNVAEAHSQNVEFMQRLEAAGFSVRPVQTKYDPLRPETQKTEKLIVRDPAAKGPEKVDLEVYFWNGHIYVHGVGSNVSAPGSLESRVRAVIDPQPEPTHEDRDRLAPRPELGRVFDDPRDPVSELAILRAAKEGRHSTRDPLTGAWKWLLREGFGVEGVRGQIGLTTAGEARLAALQAELEAGPVAAPETPPALTPERSGNFVITAGVLGENRSWRQKALDNIAAIELVKRLEAEGRQATPDEQGVLARYVGWGGIRNAFPDGEGRFGKGFEAIGQRLQDLLTEDEYATARRSIQYAHYTSEHVVRTMWSAVARMGFSGGEVFEPGMGIGHFAGMMPEDIAGRSRYQGLELDHMTSRIARHLYPDWAVRQDDYTRTPVLKDQYDLVIGNPPFADVAVQSDKAYAAHRFLLHDFFFAKSLDQVRPGGLVAFVTSAGTLNKVDSAAREYMADRADFIGAVRLPETAFESAGTNVTTDIIFLRKRAEGEPAADRSWTETVEVELPNRHGEPTKGRVNRWIAEHPEMVLGEEGFFDKLWEGRYGVRARPGTDLEADLAAAIARLPENVMTDRPRAASAAPIDFLATERKEGAFYLAEDGTLMQMRSGAGRPVEQRGKGVKGGKSAAEIERITALIPVRDSLRAVYAADMAEDEDAAMAARAALNAAYDAFVEKYGPINRAQFQFRRPSIIQQEVARAEAREEARYAGETFDEGTFDASAMIMRGASWSEIARARREARERAAEAGEAFDEGTFNPDEMPDLIIDRRPNIDAFMDDPESYRLRSIERYDDSTDTGHKTDVFFENILTREPERQINSVEDAVLYVLNKHGRFNLALVAEAASLTEQEAIERLGDRIFKVPGTRDDWVTRDEYLSGNVREKLREAQAAAERNQEFRRNVAALEEVQPVPLPPSEINANLGMPWIPTEVIEEFGREALGLKRLSVSYQRRLATWNVGGDDTSAAARSQWGTSDRAAPDLISDALNRQDPKIYRSARRSDGGTDRWLDAHATEAAQTKVQEIKQKFRDWVWSDEARATRLSELYNEQYNNLVVREYDGSYLTTPGVSANWSWRDHQKRVIARIIQSGNTYVDHTVGAGKTSEMIGAGMEMRRLGLVRKPMYVVPNHMLAQFTTEFYEQYPTAKIMVADERRFHTDRRRQFIADVANEDLDAVIITHSAFGLIPVSNEFQDELVQDELDDYRSLLEEVKSSDAEDSRITRRRVEQQIERLEQRLSGKNNRRTDQVFTFEEMGVDFLFVDEAHMFRKLDFSTKMGNVKGISPEGSGMAWDLWVKTRYLERKNPGRNLVLASGTPITNTMAELFTVSRYLQHNELVKRGLSQFDAWAGAFGDTVTQLEQDPSGGYKPVTRFAKFVNVPELSAMVRQVMDVVTSRQLDQYVTRPKLRGGQRHMNLAPKTPMLEAYQRSLADRMAIISARSGPPEPGDDIILNVINDGRHAAIDMRLVDPAAPNDPNSKLNMLVENVYQIWESTKHQPFHRPEQGGYSAEPIDYGPATQMVFSNLGVSESRGFSVHKYIVSELVRRGVPRDEIAQIANFKTHVAKARLFNDMNEGKIRVLIGSTAKMGTGVNAQRRLSDIHNLDPLWFPSDDEQRNGRGIRQGNLNPEIGIHDYSTKGTYDSTMWGLMETKARFIQGFFEGDPSIRDMDDLGEASVYEQAKAISTADERLIKLTDLRQQLERAERRKVAFEREQSAVRAHIDRAGSRKRYAEKRVVAVTEDLARRQDTTGDAFRGLVGNEEFSERAEFGDALMKALDAAVGVGKPQDEVRLAEVGGFPVMADIWFGRDSNNKKEARFQIYMERADAYESQIKWSTSAKGVVQSIEHVLRGFETELEDWQRDIAACERTIEDYSTEVGKQFTGQDEIDDLAAQVRDLEEELAADRSKNELGKPIADEQLRDVLQADLEANGYVDAEKGQTSPLMEEWRGMCASVREALAEVADLVSGAIDVPQDHKDAVEALPALVEADAHPWRAKDDVVHVVAPLLKWLHLGEHQDGQAAAGKALRAVEQRRTWFEGAVERLEEMTGYRESKNNPVENEPETGDLEPEDDAAFAAAM